MVLLSDGEPHPPGRSQVDVARETLRVTEQQVLLDAATAYMNLLRDQAVLDLQRRNVEVLTEQLKQTRDRSTSVK
jgi:outer membrane protein